MKIFFLLLIVSCSTIAAPIPLKDFFRNPVAAGYQVSPDGKKLAYLKPWEGRMNIFVRDLSKENSEQRISEIKDRDVADFFWKDDQIFYLKDFGGDENFHLYQINLKTMVEKDVTPFPKTRVELVDDLRYVSRTDILIAHNQRDPKVFDVYRLNFKTGKAKLVLQNPGDYQDYSVDTKGQIRVVTRSVGTDTEILYRDSDRAAFKPLLKFDYTRFFSPVLIPETGPFFAVSNLGRDKSSLVTFNPKTKQEEKIIYQDTEFDLDPAGFGSLVIYSHKQKKILGLNTMTWKLEQIFFDPELEKIFADIKEKSGVKVSNAFILSRDLSENIYTLVLQGDRVRANYYLYDRSKKSIQLLGVAAPWLKEGDLAEMKPFEVVVRDGMKIHGYLTLPKDYNGGPIKTVINPHGGPWARDNWRYNAEVQFLANRGFAVAQLNFRGSTGYGRQHLMASYKQWGLTMQDDITDVTKWLMKQGIADPKRTCIYGGSYGGYATLMALVKEPDLYACGVDYVGVSNLFTFMNTIPPYWSTFKEKLTVWVGDLEKDKEQFEKTSPALNADKIKKPLFIAQGAKDPRVVKAESDQMVEKLKARGVDVPYLVKDNEGHGFRNEENRFEFYTAMEEFLNKHTK